MLTLSVHLSWGTPWKTLCQKALLKLRGDARCFRWRWPPPSAVYLSRQSLQLPYGATAGRERVRLKPWEIEEILNTVKLHSRRNVNTQQSRPTVALKGAHSVMMKMWAYSISLFSDLRKAAQGICLVRNDFSGVFLIREKKIYFLCELATTLESF